MNFFRFLFLSMGDVRVVVSELYFQSPCSSIVHVFYKFDVTHVWPQYISVNNTCRALESYAHETDLVILDIVLSL